MQIFSQSRELLKAQAAKPKNSFKFFLTRDHVIVIDVIFNELFTTDKKYGLNLKRLPLPPGEVPITVFTGMNYAFVLCESNHVYGWGSNDHSQLGIGVKTEEEPIPIRLPLPKDEVVLQIGAGMGSIVVICVSGNIYVCGWGFCGALGTGDMMDHLVPISWRLPNGDIPLQVACGGTSTIILSRNKRLYGFGFNSHGQLGVSIEKTCSLISPSEIKLPGGAIPVQVAVGYKHTLVMCENGKVFSMGSNSFGSLGLGHQDYEYSPQLVLLPGGITPRKIIAGDSFSAVLCLDNRLYIFGLIAKEIHPSGILSSSHMPVLLNLPNEDVPVDIVHSYGRYMIICQSGAMIGNHELTFTDKQNGIVKPINNINALADATKKLRKEISEKNKVRQENRSISSVSIKREEEKETKHECRLL